MSRRPDTVRDSFDTLLNKIRRDMEECPGVLSRIMRARAVAVLLAAMGPSAADTGKTLDVSLALKATEIFLKHESKLLGADLKGKVEADKPPEGIEEDIEKALGDGK